MLHILSHFLVPFIVAKIGFPKIWVKAWLIMSATMLVDLDHLLADPIYDPNRCSINFHPLHTYWAIAFYVVLIFPKQTRLIGIGLVIHMLLDWQECIYRLPW